VETKQVLIADVLRQSCGRGRLINARARALFSGPDKMHAGMVVGSGSENVPEGTEST
jgi:hypothetical protein